MASIHTLSDHYNFIKELIRTYKESVLWQKKHPHFWCKPEREKAYENIIRNCKKYWSEVDEDYVKHKIATLRNNFRKEYKRVQTSKQTAKCAKDVYRPRLWYYNLLKFLVGEESCENPDLDDDIDESSLESSVQWNRRYLIMLIKLYEQTPCLYVSSKGGSGLVGQRKRAIVEITNKLTKITGKKFTRENVRKRINTVRSQFIKEYKKAQYRKTSNPSYEPAWWPYNFLKFLIPHHQPKDYSASMSSLANNENVEKSATTEIQKFETQSNTNSNDSTLVETKPIRLSVEMNNKKQDQSSENDEDHSHDDEESEEDDASGTISPKLRLDALCDIANDQDIFDTISRNVGHQLRHMTEDQRKIAERLIKDLMYYGQMEDLTPETKLSLS